MINLNKLYKRYLEEDLSFSIEDYDWRELIYQMALDFYQHNQDIDFLNKLKEKNPWTKEGRTGYEQYYSDLQGFWRQLYNPLERDSDRLIADIQKFEYYTDGNDKYWNKAIHLNPNSLKFWFDFLDIGGALGNYSVDKIGTRSKVVNDNAVKSIYYKETPEVLFVVMPQENVEGLEKTAYTPIWIQNSMQTLFYRSTQGLDAITRVNELLQQHLMNSESISITSIPIYYLQPNTRIYVQGQGDFTLDKISYQLSYNGTMNLSCNKIIKQFI